MNNAHVIQSLNMQLTVQQKKQLEWLIYVYHAYIKMLLYP